MLNYDVRHVTLCIASPVTLTAAWGLIPLTGAVFKAETKMFVRPVLDVARGTLLAAEDQTNRLNAGIFNAAYAYIWLNASLTGCTTEDQALLPINISSDETAAGASALLSALTTSFTIDIACTAPEPTSGLGCERSVPAPWSSDEAWVSNI